MKSKDNNPGTLFWPPFVDITFMTILILILMNLLQFVLNQDIFKMEEIEKRKAIIWDTIQTEFPRECYNKIITKNDDSPQMLLIRFSDRILFERGKYDLTTEGEDIIQRLALLITDYTDFFRAVKVQGHTDDLQFRNPEIYNNWDLSSDRAKTVVKAIIKGLPEKERERFQKLLVAAGYSQFHPVQTTTPDEAFDRYTGNELEGNPLNRRIDIEFEFLYSGETHEQ